MQLYGNLELNKLGPNYKNYARIIIKGSTKNQSRIYWKHRILMFLVEYKTSTHFSLFTPFLLFIKLPFLTKIQGMRVQSTSCNIFRIIFKLFSSDFRPQEEDFKGVHKKFSFRTALNAQPQRQCGICLGDWQT